MVQRETFGVWHLSIFWLTLSFIVKLPMIYFSSADADQARVVMGEVHEGICGTHQSALKMKWLLRRAGFCWPSMISDCFKYYKGCEECQRFGDLQLVPAASLYPIIKPWPFRGWGWILLDKLILHLQRGITSC